MINGIHIPVNVTEHANGAGFDIQFTNGNVSIPDLYGGYTVSCGCGSGKTTAIAEMIKMKYNEGVLYCVDTKSELDKMFDSLRNKGIKDEDMLVIHQDVDKDILGNYYSHPESIVWKKVILITHCRLFADLINYFVLYKVHPPIPSFDGNFEALMQRQDIRRYIFLDETPLFFKPFAILSRAVVGNFMKEVNGKWVCKTPDEMRRAYHEFIENTDADFFRTSNALNNLKKDIVFNLIPKHLNKWLNTERRGNYLSLHFYTSDLVQKGMNSHVVVFEGAGDILLKTSTSFSLLDIQEKYNTNVQFKAFNYELKRHDKRSNAAIDKAVDTIANVINSNSGKFLVVVWKDIGTQEDAEWIYEKAGDSAFRDMIASKLVIKKTNEERFAVTYYGASNTKSTNEFVDYDNIILCGNWEIPPNKVKQINEAYISDTTAFNQKMWYFAQLITRTSIRKHRGGNVKVWYSSDFDRTLIDGLDLYLNQNILCKKEESKNTWLDKLKEQKIRKEQIEDIIKLNELDNNVSLSILGNRTYTMQISLNDLCKICPKSTQKKVRYEVLVKKLDLMGITLLIT